VYLVRLLSPERFRGYGWVTTIVIVLLVIGFTWWTAVPIMAWPPY
jgi:hypothetical protein